MKTLSDTEYEAVRASLDNAIHELVHACRHLEEDDAESAAQALMTAQGTIEEVANQVAALQ